MVVVAVVVVGVLAAVVAMVVVSRQVERSGPDEVLVIAGRTQLGPGASAAPVRLVRSGGRAMRLPIVERVARMSLERFLLDIHVSQALTASYIPLNLKGVATVQFAKEESVLLRAIQRFLGTRRADVARQLQRIVQAAVRTVAARITPEQLSEDKLAFEQGVTQSGGHDLAQLGLELESFHLTDVSDEVGYLDALGRIGAAGIKVEAVGARQQMDAEAEAHLPEAERALEPAIVDSPEPARETTADPLAFLPEPDSSVRLRIRAVDPDSGETFVGRFNPSELSLESERSRAATTISLLSPFTVTLGRSSEGGETLLQLTVRQERFGKSAQIGLSSTTTTFASPVTGLLEVTLSCPRLEETDMIGLLAGLRAVMQSRGEESWGL